MWTENYEPKSLEEFIGQKEAVEVFLRWMKRRKPGKAILFYGPPGTGKTVLVQAYASENKLDLIELNASDYRSASQIKEVLSESVQQQSLFRRGKIFMIDEIDGLAGNEDRGGVGEIIDVIKKSQFPIILTANNPYNPRLRMLRNYCQLVQFRKITVWDVEKKLKKICESEKIEVTDGTLRNLAKISDGDLRSAINDLESLSRGRTSITEKDLESLSVRERETSIFDALKIIFKSQSVLGAKLSINNVDKDPDEIFWWIENNIANEYEEPEEIAKAFDILSRADLFRQWIASRQNWKLKAYMIDLMTGGVATAKREMYRKFTRYQYPDKLIVLGRTKESRAETREVLNKISQQLHCSTRKIRKEYLPFFKLMIKNPKVKKEMAESFGLDKEEIKLL